MPITPAHGDVEREMLARYDGMPRVADRSRKQVYTVTHRKLSRTQEMDKILLGLNAPYG